MGRGVNSGFRANGAAEGERGAPQPSRIDAVPCGRRGHREDDRAQDIDAAGIILVLILLLAIDQR